MSEDKKELNEKELDKVNGGIDISVTPVYTPDLSGHTSDTKPLCDGSSICFGSICPEYDSCTQSIKEQGEQT